MQTLATTVFLRFAVAPALILVGVAQEPARRGRVTGRVFDAYGEGVTAAKISTWRSPDRDKILHHTVTDADGMFVLSNIDFDDTYSLWIEAESKSRCADTGAVLVSATQPEGWCTLRLWDAGTVDVEVVDTDGEPLAGVQVLAMAHHSRIFGFTPNATGVTGDDGHALLDGVALGAIDVRAWREGRPMASATTWLRDEATVELKLEDRGGVALRVRVEGLPEQCEAKLSVLSYENGSFIALPPLTNELVTTGGVWSMQTLPDIEYRLRVSLDGFVVQPAQMKLEPGKGPHDAVFTLRPTGSLQLHGVLRGADGKPIANESVCCRASNYSEPATGMTDAAGRFEIDSALAAGEKAIFEVAGGRWTLQQTKTDTMYGGWDARFMGRHESVIDPAEEYALTAIAALAIDGRVVDGEGKPVRGRRVQLQESRPNRMMPSWMMVRGTTTDVDGAFVFRGVYPLPQAMRVSLGEIGATACEPFTAESGQDVRDIVLKAVPLGVVEGIARDEHGMPLPGARVWLRNYDPNTGRQTDGSVNEILSDRQGRFRFLGVEPGGHRIELCTLDRKPVAHSPAFAVEPGAVVSIDVGTGR